MTQAFNLITAGSQAILTFPLLRAFCDSNCALAPLVRGEILLRLFNCADRRSLGFLTEDDVCLACSGRFKWRRYASLWRAIVCEAVRLCNRGVPSSVMPPVFEPTPKLLARDVFEGQNMRPDARGVSLSKRLCQRTISSTARPAVPSDPASSVLFLGRPSSRSSSMSWSRPTTSAGGKLSFTIGESERREVRTEFAAPSSRPASSAKDFGGDGGSARSVSSRQSSRFGVVHSRLAPPPSPFTLQGLFLQQQLEFCPESKSSARIGQYCNVVSEGRGLGSALPPLRQQLVEDPGGGQQAKE